MDYKLQTSTEIPLVLINVAIKRKGENMENIGDVEGFLLCIGLIIVLMYMTLSNTGFFKDK
jgi:hypothetical protein